MTTLLAEFTVVGTPVPQGSTRAFSRGGKIHTTNDPQGTIERWRGDIRSALRDQAKLATLHGFVDPPHTPTYSPISMRLAFRLPRPKKHYLGITKARPRPELRPDAPTWAPGGKDLDKLVRAVLDALTGVLYVDDGQVVVIGATKEYAGAFTNAPHEQQPGVDVRVSAL